MSSADTPASLLDLCGLRGGRRLVWQLTREMIVVDRSDQAEKMFPDLRVGGSFFESFDFLRPRRVKDPSEMLDHGDELVLAVPRVGHCAIRGSLLQTGTGEQHLLFFGAPWLTWMRENRPDIKLGFEDFDTADSQLDLLFVLASERQHLKDLEALTAELNEARNQLVEASSVRTERIAEVKDGIRADAAALTGLLDSLEKEGSDTALISAARAQVAALLDRLSPN